MEKIKNGQIKYIHILKNKLNLKDETYRTLLNSKFNKNTSKDLSSKQAEILIKILERLIDNYATEKQKNKLNSLYSKVYKEKDKTVDNITVKECSKLIYILEEIVDWQEKRKLNYSKINKGEEWEQKQR